MTIVHSGYDLQEYTDQHILARLGHTILHSSLTKIDSTSVYLVDGKLFVDSVERKVPYRTSQDLLYRSLWCEEVVHRR